MREAFEIVYADGSVVAGSTIMQFRNAPEGEDYADDGILFVIVRYKGGEIIKHKAISTYEYHGATKQGALTTDENYQRVKDELPQLSRLL